MEELKQTVMVLLRKGATPLEITYWLDRLKEELITTRDYMQAIKDSDFAP